jgi:hypothetical protein
MGDWFWVKKMIWHEMNKIVRAAYIEGVKDTAEGAAIDDETLEFMWECSDAACDLPDTTQPSPSPTK